MRPVRGFSSLGTFSMVIVRRAAAASTRMVWVLRETPGSAQISTRVRSGPTPASASAAATFTFAGKPRRSEEHTSELQSRQYLVCRLLLEKNIYLLSFYVPLLRPPHPIRFLQRLGLQCHLCAYICFTYALTPVTQTPKLKSRACILIRPML